MIVIKELGYLYIYFRNCFQKLKEDMHKQKYNLPESLHIGYNTMFYGDGDIEIGENTIIRSYGRISSTKGQKIKIGNNVTISHFLFMSTGNRISQQDFSIKPHIKHFGDIIIEDNCFIGYNVFIKEGVHIGKNVVIGAHSVVTHNIPEYSLAVGCPAKVVKKIEI